MEVTDTTVRTRNEQQVMEFDPPSIESAISKDQGAAATIDIPYCIAIPAGSALVFPLCRTFFTAVVCLVVYIKLPC